MSIKHIKVIEGTLNKDYYRNDELYIDGDNLIEIIEAYMGRRIRILITDLDES